MATSRHVRTTWSIATATTLFLSVAAAGQVLIDMPADPRPPAAADPVDESPDLGDIALHRYAWNRNWPRDTYYVPNPWWWWYRPIGYFPAGYTGPRPYWGYWGYPYWGWYGYGYGWPYRGWAWGGWR